VKCWRWCWWWGEKHCAITDPCDSNTECCGTFCLRSVFIVLPSHQPVRCEGGGRKWAVNTILIDGRSWIPAPSWTPPPTYMEHGLQLFCDWQRWIKPIFVLTGNTLLILPSCFLTTRFPTFCLTLNSLLPFGIATLSLIILSCLYTSLYFSICRHSSLNFIMPSHFLHFRIPWLYFPPFFHPTSHFLPFFHPAISFFSILSSCDYVYIEQSCYLTSF
jgi:hypothetical protein